MFLQDKFKTPNDSLIFLVGNLKVIYTGIMLESMNNVKKFAQYEPEI